MKRYVAEFENDFERAYEKKRKEFGEKIPESLFNRAVRARNSCFRGILTAKEAVREILDAWNELDQVF